MPKGGCDCYLVDRQVIEVLNLMDEKNTSLTLQVMWCGFKSEMVYFDRKDREKGKSMWTMSKKIKLVVDSMISFSYKPIRYMTVTGLICAAISLVGIIWVIAEKLSSNTPVMGYTSLACIVLFGFGLLFIMLGVLGEYIWRVLEEAKKRPPYIIDEIRRTEDNRS